MTSMPNAAETASSLGPVFHWAEQVLEGAQQLTALNIQALKTLHAEAKDQVVSSIDQPADLMTLQAATLRAAPEKAFAYSRQVQEIFATFRAARRAALEQVVANAQVKFIEEAGGFFRNTSMATNVQALVQSAVDTSNSSYKSLQATSKQLSDSLTSDATTVGEAVGRASNAALSKTMGG